MAKKDAKDRGMAITRKQWERVCDAMIAKLESLLN